MSDSLNENSTTILVRVKDVNDLPPKFTSNNYTVTINEELIGVQKIVQVIFIFSLTQLLNQCFVSITHWLMDPENDTI